MTQDDRWLQKYNEVKSVIETNKRNPSRYDDNERGLCCNGIKKTVLLECVDIVPIYSLLPISVKKRLADNAYSN